MGVNAAAMTDAELAAHLATVAGRLLLEVRASGLLSAKALGKAGDAPTFSRMGSTTPSCWPSRATSR